MRRAFFFLSFLLLSLSPAWGQSSTKFDYFFYEAMRQKLAQHHDAAIDLFDYCRQLNPESGAVLSELAGLYRYVKNDSLAVASLEKACQLYPDNYWYHDGLASLYLESRQFDKALPLVESMAQQWPTKSEVLMLLLELYERNNDYANMVAVLDKIEVKEGKSEQLSTEKFRLYLQMKDEKRAFEEMRELAEEYPNDLRYQVIIGDLYLDAGRKEEALRQYKEVEAKDSTQVSLQLSLSNYYQQEGPDSLYQHYLSRLLTNPAIDDEARARLMGVLVYENLNQQADSVALLNLFDRVLQQAPEDNALLELRVRYMVTRHMPSSDVKPYLLRMLAIDPENDMARQQLLSYAVAEEDTLGLVDICKPAVDYHVADPVYYYYLGVGYFQLDEKEKAVEAFKGGLEKVDNASQGNQQQMRVNIYALLGNLYHDLGQDDKAFQAYDSCLVYKQNDAMVLNNYAYYLALHKKDLKRAEEMSRQANEIEPDNATYLDTHAWILYQQKRYAEAKQYMDRVVQLMKRDGEEMSDEVAEHIKRINKKNKTK